jgi:membrane-associated phospholipid phosphatase
MMADVSRATTARRRCAAGVGLVVALTLAGSPVAADRPELDIDWRLHVPIVLVGGLGWVLSESLVKSDLSDDQCSWCESNRFDDGVRARLRWSDPTTAHTLSNVAVYAIAPASAFGLTALAAWRDDRAGDWVENGFAVLEATVLAADLAQLVKMQAGRARPYMSGDPALMPADAAIDGNRSFYSGHTSFAFSLAVASGTVASMRGYRAAPAVWAAGLSAAAATGWLRIAADRHYASDVLTGALVGSAIGFAVPYFFHRRKATERPTWRSPAVGLSPSPSGALLSLDFGW